MRLEPDHDRSATGRRFGLRKTLRLRLALVVALVVALAPALARADEVDDFTSALRAYSSNEFDLAAARFRSLLSGAPLTNVALREASRRYYAATLVYLNRAADARAVFSDLLRENPGAQVDALQFSPGVVAVFESVRRELAPEIAEIQRARASALEAERQRRIRDGVRLREQLVNETIYNRTPRIAMFVPFGVGQFVNGNVGLGALLATLQGLQLLAGISTVIASEVLYPPRFPPERPYNDAELGPMYALTTANVVSFSLLAATALLGVIEANVSYRGDRRVTRQRNLPGEVLRIPELRPLQISFGPPPSGQGVLLTGTLRF